MRLDLDYVNVAAETSVVCHSDLLLSAVNRPTYMCFHSQLDEKGGWGLVLDGKVRNL